MLVELVMLVNWYNFIQNAAKKEKSIKREGSEKDGEGGHNSSNALKLLISFQHTFLRL